MNKKFIYWGISASALIWWLAVFINQEEPKTEIKEIQRDIKIIQSKIWDKVSWILEIDNLCDNWQKFFLDKTRSHKSNLTIRYTCEDDSTKLNWVNQIPAVPWIPTWTPLPF